MCVCVCLSEREEERLCDVVNFKCVYVHKKHNILLISFQIILYDWVKTCIPLSQ